jgi:hypothetical protein
MKLGDLLARLDSDVDTYFDSDSLIQELGLHGSVDLGKYGFTTRPITVWYCTDTWVGRNAVYFNGELVAITDQEGRKCDIYWEWASIEAYHIVLQCVRDAIDNEIYPIINIFDPNKDIGDPVYRLNYASEVLTHCHHKTAIFQGRTVEVIAPANNNYICKEMKINDNGEEKVANLKELWFKVPLRDS